MSDSDSSSSPTNSYHEAEYNTGCVAIASDSEEGIDTHEMRLSLVCNESRCDMYYYECHFCPRQFPLSGFKESDMKDHLRAAHITHVVYRGYAAEACAGGSVADYALHPDLLGTTVNDQALRQYKKSAVALRKEMSANDPHIFPYVQVTILSSDRRLFCCAYCRFTSFSLLSYKKHVVFKHVVIFHPYLTHAAKLVAAEARSGLEVFGPPHDV